MAHKMASMAVSELKFSIECQDDAEGSPGVIVFDDQTIPLPPPQEDMEWSASDGGQGSQSSVRPFQHPHDEQQDSPMDLDPQEPGSSFPSSSVQPFQSAFDEKESPMDLDPQETGGSSPASIEEERGEEDDEA